MGFDETLNKLEKDLVFLNLAMLKHSREYKKDFFETLEEDATEMFNKFKRLYEKNKDTNASYISNLEKFLMYFEKHFEETSE